jgi:hypothetical protein
VEFWERAVLVFVSSAILSAILTYYLTINGML